MDGTIRLCADLGVDPEDVVLLAVAYELKSPAMGQWTRKGWTDGWKALGCVPLSLDSPEFRYDADLLVSLFSQRRVDTIPAMKTQLETLRNQMARDTEYFRRVYNYTFEFSRPPGQRSLGASLHPYLMAPSCELGWFAA